MQQFEAEILIQAPLMDCFQQWIASDYYPIFKFKETPVLPQKWSSSDAWGENCISGTRQLDWNLSSYPDMPLKQIYWHIQTWLKKRLIDYSGFVTFEALANGAMTKIVLQVNWNQLETIAETEASEMILWDSLENFQKIMQHTLPKLEQHLRVAV